MIEGLANSLDPQLLQGHSNGPMDADTIRMLFDPSDNFKIGRGSLEVVKARDGYEEPGNDALATFCVLGGQPDRVVMAESALEQVRHASARGDPSFQSLDRSLGCMLGNICGDALGAPLEFVALRYGSAELKGMSQVDIWDSGPCNKFKLKPGQWTDDGAMALCVADSLLCCGDLDPYDLRHRFHAWSRYGYNNAFGRDPHRESRASVGMGGNMFMSMGEWLRHGSAYTTEGDKSVNGNGTAIRNGAVPVFFRTDITVGMAAAYNQSRTTHLGEEAAELCRLLTFISTKFINGADHGLLSNLSEFESPLYSVMCLAKAVCEERQEENVGCSLDRRRWNWRSSDYRYCKYRAETNPGPTYVGSYAMDCVAMAIHCVYTTSSFTDATLKAANLCGDSDSVSAVVGQLAGALYGASSIPQDWLAHVKKYDGGTIAARALMLHNHEAVGSEAMSAGACASAQLLPASTNKGMTFREKQTAFDCNISEIDKSIDRLRQHNEDARVAAMKRGIACTLPTGPTELGTIGEAPQQAFCVKPLMRIEGVPNEGFVGRMAWDAPLNLLCAAIINELAESVTVTIIWQGRPLEGTKTLITGKVVNSSPKGRARDADVCVDFALSLG